MTKKMSLDEIAERLVQIKKRNADIQLEKQELDDEQAELEETFKLVAKKRDIRGVPVDDWFVGVAKSIKVEITDEKKLLATIKARKWDKIVIQPKLVKEELNKLIKAEHKKNKAVPGARVVTGEYVKTQQRKGDEDAE